MVRRPGDLSFQETFPIPGLCVESSGLPVAIMFLIFDVEAIFLIPFAVAFTGLPVGAFIAILVFLLLLIEGLVWAWSKGCLQWER